MPADSNRYDAIVIGGGHNGLVAAAYLACAGKRTVVLERRPVVGGAAVTEQPWGPKYKVTMLSYVVSLLSPTILRAPRPGTAWLFFGVPAGSVLRALPDGRLAVALRPCPPPRRDCQVLRADADAIDRWDEWLQGLAGVLGPLLTSIPPKLGSTRPRICSGRRSWPGRSRVSAWGRRRHPAVLDERRRPARRLLRVAADARRALGLRVIGTWAGPRSLGTALVMAHHQIGDARRR